MNKARALKKGNLISSPAKSMSSVKDMTVDLAYTSKNEENTLFYVFNYSDGGFAIIGGDERAKVILGYCDNGMFNVDSIPDGLKYMLSCYSEQIASAIENSTPIEPTQEGDIASSRSSIETLVTTKWNQRVPFNRAIPILDGFPESDSYRFVTGCGATAVAQILKYYKYPTKGIGSRSYTYTYTAYGKDLTFSADFANTAYDWDNMIDSYSGSYTTAQEQAVSVLMYHAGVALHMAYGWSASSSYTDAVLPGLITYFGYSQNASYANRSSNSDTEWENLVYNELQAGHPLFYTGQSNKAGHAFVCDGYDSSTSNFHINWGWGGYCDGYYPLTGTGALQPNGSGIGGAGADAAYTESQTIIVGLRPSSESVPVSSISLNSTSVSLPVGETKTLMATITPTNATNKSVTWTSSNTSVAVVNTSGVVNAKTAGTATITCTAADGSGKSATCSVTVTSSIIDGDVNGDHDVDVSDVALTVEYILGHNPSGFTFAAADLDKDGVLDVADVALMVNIIMHGTPSGRSSNHAKGKAVENTPYLYITAGDHDLNLWLQDADNTISALQFDLALQEGVELRDVLPSSFMTQHSVSSSQLENGMTRVLCISLSNATLSPDEHSILSLLLSEQVANLADLRLKNVIATTPYGEKKFFNGISWSGATPINHTTADTFQQKEIYSVNGQKRQLLQNGVNVVKTDNGDYKKIIVKK